MDDDDINCFAMQHTGAHEHLVRLQTDLMIQRQRRRAHARQRASVPYGPCGGVRVTATTLRTRTECVVTVERAEVEQKAARQLSALTNWIVLVRASEQLERKMRRQEPARH